MQLYFASDLDSIPIVLDPVESHHIVNVMRLGAGSIIHVTDGKGRKALATISIANARSCEIEINNFIDSAIIPYQLQIAIAPTKNIDRFEWFLEKATEIGISVITPILCKRSERKLINEERLNKLMLSAAKQSGKTFFPKLNALIKFDQFINSRLSGKLMIAHCNEDSKKLIKNVYSPGEAACILIGPEGDFDTEEVAGAVDKGFIPISLGEARLRTETAGVVACHSISFINEI